jgi:hypothetical protein
LKDIINYILPLFWNYSSNLLLMLANPYSIFSHRMRDDIFFKDSVAFLAISCLISSLLTSTIASTSEINFTSIALGAANYFSTIFVVSLFIYLCWLLFGYRGKASTILMPFNYAGGCGLIFSTVTGLILFGFLKIYSPEVFKAFLEVLRECSAGGFVGSGRKGIELGIASPFDQTGFLMGVVYCLSTLLFLTALCVGAYRTALATYRLKSELANAVMVLVSLVFIGLGLLLSEAISESLNFSNKDCVSPVTS